MIRITSLQKFWHNLWRSWLRSESPRRAVLQWSSPDKAGLIVVCFVLAIISGFHWLQVPELTPGMVAITDQLAPKDALVKYKDPENQKGSELIQSTIFVQVIDKKQSNLLYKNLTQKLKELEIIASSNNAERVGPINLSKEEQMWLSNRTKTIQEKWEKEISLAANRMLSQGLVNTLSFEQIREASSLQLAQLGARETPSRSIGIKLLSTTFHGRSNLKRDSALQGLLEDTITKQNRNIIVNTGDVITKKGEPISPQAYYVLDHFKLIKKSPKYLLFLKAFTENLASTLVLILIMRRERPCLQPRHGLLGVGLLITAQLAQLSKGLIGASFSPLAILVPPTLLVSQGLGSTTALAWLAVASLQWQIPINGMGEGRMMVACAVSAIVALQAANMRSRAQLLQMAFLMPFGALLSEWFLLRGRGVPNSSDQLLYEAVVMGSLLMMTILLVPIIENTFGLITKARLMELTDQERPLLRRLSSEAPGTFEHTLMICGLAEEGARSIGADVDLIRTGSLYHDVGKLHAPEWFIENQEEGINPHDQLNDPYASANVLQAHVDEGLKLARRHRLPRPVADFIPEHQGTLKMGYFLHQARKLNPSVSESQFRYRGPSPRSRETAILMLADGCEAALRSLDPKTTDSEACKTVRLIVEARQHDGQLKDSSLTRAEVELVIRAFVTVWRRMRHRRIPYPISSTKRSFPA